MSSHIRIIKPVFNAFAVVYASLLLTDKFVICAMWSSRLGPAGFISMSFARKS